MEVFTTLTDIENFIKNNNRKTIGLVPTMGALHEGHLSLVTNSLKENDLTITSIFVNPTQFNNLEDLAKYPRTIESDLKMLENTGCKIVFTPSEHEMYPTNPLTNISFGEIESVMEGKSRPGHFNGVGLVVTKLFNITTPNRAYFGQKDLQQVAIIKQMVQDLSIPVQLVICPTLRDADGLAKSSRNRRLSTQERILAPLIFQKLLEAKMELLSGKGVMEVKYNFEAFFTSKPEFKLDYFEVVNCKTLQSVENLLPEKQNALCVAIFLGEIRLIDNIIF